MGDRNASPSAFGWDFQVNSAILLMLENIKDVKRVRVEEQMRISKSLFRTKVRFMFR